MEAARRWFSRAAQCRPGAEIIQPGRGSLFRRYALEADQLGGWECVDGLCQPGLVAGWGVLLDHAFLYRLVDHAECTRQYGLGIGRFSGFDSCPELPHLRLEFVTVSLIESFELDALTVPL